MNNNQNQIDDFMYRTFGYPPLRKAPTPSGLSEEEHAALTRRFPAPAPAPATHESETPETAEDWAETHSALLPSDEPDTPSLRFSSGDSMYSRRGAAYRAARPRQSRTGLRPHGADEEGTPMRTMRVNGQAAITHKRGIDDVPLPREALRDNEEAKEANQRLAAEHVKRGTLTNGTEFLNLGGLAKHQTDLIAKEYAKWRESGGGPRPDLSKYEDPVARHKDGTPWDYRETADRLTRLHRNATGYDATHKEHEPALRLSSSGNLQALDPQYIWSHLEQGENPKRTLGWRGPRSIYLDELKRTGLRPDQYSSQARSLMNLGLHHQRLSRLHAEEEYVTPLQRQTRAIISAARGMSGR